jgi:hypothetical protein
MTTDPGTPIPGGGAQIYLLFGKTTVKPLPQLLAERYRDLSNYDLEMILSDYDSVDTYVYNEVAENIFYIANILDMFYLDENDDLCVEDSNSPHSQIIILLGGADYLREVCRWHERSRKRERFRLGPVPPPIPVAP